MTGPWALLSACVAAIAVVGGTARVAYTAGANAQQVQARTTADLIEMAGNKAASMAAKVIAAQRPRNVTITQEATHEIQTNTVYRDCVHSAGQLQRINAAITGRDQPGRQDPGTDGVRPKTGAAD